MKKATLKNTESLAVIVTGISKHYSDVTAKDNLRLELGKGEIIGLLGLNGSGKSTLIKMTLGSGYEQA